MKKLFSTRQIILIAILVLAAILRFWDLGNVPPSASLDEASIGYNAYSVLKTGGDEYGQFPFISQRGYDDWRRSTYLFLVTPFIALFDLNVVSVRLPAVILSILTVWAVYHIIFSLFSKRSAFSSAVALLASFLLAISPWHIYISRLGHESNTYLSFLIFGVLLFLQGERNKNWAFILVAGIFFTLSMISYYAGQVFIPLFVMGLFFLFRRNLLSIVLSDKKIFVIFFIFLILLAPILKGIFSNEALIRFQGTSIFKPEVHGEKFRKRVELWNKAVERGDIVGAIVYSRHLFPLKVVIEGYISHFKPEWLFTNPSAQPHKVPNMGLLYLWEIPFIVIGIVAFLFSHAFDTKVKKLIFLWFFLAAFPAAIATQAPHVMRSYAFLPTWQIFSALGLISIYTFLKNQTYRNIMIVIASGIIFLSITYFYRQYFIVFPREQSASFQYALSKTIPFVRQLADEKPYNKIIFSNKDNLYQSYMFFLFFSKYDPAFYQKQGGTKSGGFAEIHKFGKFEFRPIVWNEENGTSTLYVGNINDFPGGVEVKKIFSYLNGKEAIKVVERK